MPTRKPAQITKIWHGTVAAFRKHELGMAGLLFILSLAGRVTTITTSWTTLAAGLLIALVMMQQAVLRPHAEAILRVIHLMEGEPNPALRRRLRTIRQLNLACDGVKLALLVGSVILLRQLKFD